MIKNFSDFISSVFSTKTINNKLRSLWLTNNKTTQCRFSGTPFFYVQSPLYSRSRRSCWYKALYIPEIEKCHWPLFLKIKIDSSGKLFLPKVEIWKIMKNYEKLSLPRHWSVRARMRSKRVMVWRHTTREASFVCIVCVFHAFFMRSQTRYFLECADVFAD